jgi:hypothetical protein
MSSTLRTCSVPLFLILILATAAATAKTGEVTGFAWHGSDVVLTLSDSVGYGVDLARSDTSEVVLALASASIAVNLRSRSSGMEAPSERVAISIAGPDGRVAVLTGDPSGGSTLRIHDDGDLGYAVLWRPFVKQLVVHTFSWEGLGYGEGQYYQGLIALEQGVDDQAEELLSIAASTGDSRAKSVLGSWYARHGEDSLAIRFLAEPAEAEDHAALAAVLERQGDTAAAAGHVRESQDMLARGAARRSPGSAPSGTAAGGQRGAEDEIIIARERNTWLLIIFALVAVVLTGGVLIAALRRRRRRGPAVDYKRAMSATAKAPRENAAFRVVKPEVADDTAPVPDLQTAAGSEHASERDVEPVSPGDERSAAPPAVEPVSSVPPRPSSPTPWTSAAAHGNVHPTERSHEAVETQASDLQERLRAAEQRPRVDEPTVDAARRLNLSRDNVELRKRMEAAASGRDRNVPD